MLGPTVLRVVGQQCCVRLHGSKMLQLLLFERLCCLFCRKPVVTSLRAVRYLGLKTLLTKLFSLFSAVTAGDCFAPNAHPSKFPSSSTNWPNLCESVTCVLIC